MRLFPSVAPLVLLAVAALLAGACASGETSDSVEDETSSTSAAIGTLMNDEGWPRVEGLRGKRYCEVLLARIVDGRLNAEVWNTFGLNECPEAEWNALDAATIKTERDVIVALLNGPRYFLMDAIEKKPSDNSRRITTFGTLDMFLGATVDLGPIPPNLSPFTERIVARETVFEFDARAKVYEILDSRGRVYIMQSYKAQPDGTLTEADLADLGERLTLPEGWTYRVRTLDEQLRVGTSGADATVVQDEFMNTYQLIESS